MAMGLLDLFRGNKGKRGKKKTASSTNKNTQMVFTKVETSVTITEPDIDKAYSIPLDGLLIGDIIFLDWINGKSTSAEVPQYFVYQYGINFNNSIKKLKKKGLLRFATPSEALSNLKVTELKTLLKENDLTQSGKKADLINRIADNIDETNYQDKVPASWSITDEANTILKRYQLLVWGHKNSDNMFTVNPATLLPYINSDKSNFEIALSLSEQSFRKNIKDLNFGLAESDLNYQITLNEKEQNYDESLRLALGAFIIELTGNSNIGDGPVYFFKNFLYTDNIKQLIVKYQQKLNLSTDDLETLLSELYPVYEPHLYKVRMYKNLAELQKAFDILLNGTKDEMNKLLNKWYNRIPDAYKLD